MTIKRRLLYRIILGFPIGVTFGHIIEILYALGRERFQPCVPAFVEWIGSETGAVALQMLLCGIMGAMWAGTSLIYETDWGITRQTALHFLIGAGTVLPVAYVLHWMEHSMGGFFGYLAVFAAIFATIWATTFFSLKGRLKKMNERLREKT